jgi:hypothetical protein
MTDAAIGVVIDPKRKGIMKARYDNSESFGESLSARGEDFWHSVWKGIEDIPRDDALAGNSLAGNSLAGNREVTLEAPRDYVVDSENCSAARST